MSEDDESAVHPDVGPDPLSTFDKVKIIMIIQMACILSHKLTSNSAIPFAGICLDMID
jgi:hypothetical protein